MGVLSNFDKNGFLVCMGVLYNVDLIRTDSWCIGVLYNVDKNGFLVFGSIV